MSISQGRRWALALAFWLTLAFTVLMAVMPDPAIVGGSGGAHAPDATPGILAWLGALDDRLQHIAAFSAMALLAAAAYPRATLLRIGERLSFFGAVLELVQALPAVGRDCEIQDWLIDTVALIAVLSVIHLIRQRRARPAL
jgi:hypothetical protein